MVKLNMGKTYITKQTMLKLNIILNMIKLTMVRLIMVNLNFN